MAGPAMVQRLERGECAVNGWHQIFFYDPDGNVTEVHQVDQN